MSNYFCVFSFVLFVLAVFLACAGCKFSIKEYSSSVGELSAETTKGI